MEKDQLQEYLNALDRGSCYRTEAVFKDAENEKTELVYFVGNNGSELGPFVRKTISKQLGQGAMYEKIYQAQLAGKRFVHLPRIFECYSTGTHLVVVSEYAQGETLQELVQAKGASPQLALHLFPKICDAVQELHEAFNPPLIHRDLTPANIIVSDQNIFIIDLGIARTFRPDETHDTTYFGTRAYAPPEQFGFGQTDVRSDVYALGKVLAFCSGLAEGSAEKIAVNNTEDSAEQPGESTAENLPETPAQSAAEQALAQVVKTATSLDPKDRYQSVFQLKAAVLSASNIHALSSLPQPVSPQPENQKQSNPPLTVPSVAQAKAAASPAQQPALSSAETAAPSAQQSRGATIKQPQPAGKFNHALSAIPVSLGCVWNVVVVLCWLLFCVSAVSLIVAPEGIAQADPLWLRIVEYLGVIIVPFTIICYYVLDLRLIRKKFPHWKLPSRRKTWFIGLGLIVFCIVVVAIIMGLVGMYTS